MAGERDGLYSLAETHLVAEEEPSVECKAGRHAFALEGQKFGLVDHPLAIKNMKKDCLAGRGKILRASL